MADLPRAEIQARIWRRPEPALLTTRRVIAVVLMVAGALLVAVPTTGEWLGEWSQHRQAVEVDAQRTRYLWSATAGYATQSAAFEDSIVAFEFGARPRNAAGAELLPTNRPVRSIDASLTVAPPSTLLAAEPAVAVAEPPLAIRIPSIGVDQAVVDGVSRSHLRNGPGHYPGTALPGQPGNMVISGHRTTYTRPFYALDLLEAGDSVFVDTASGTFEYVVTEAWVVDPNDVSPLDATEEAALTLTTCTPKGSARQRLIVRAELAGPGAPDGGI